MDILTALGWMVVDVLTFTAGGCVCGAIFEHLTDKERGES